jgi:hypothetical protein
MSDTLWNSFSNATKAFTEAEALLEALGESLSSMPGTPVDPGLAEEDWNEGDWVTGYYLNDFPLARNRLKLRGTVSAAVSFWRAEDEVGAGWEGAQLAKLYVGFAPAPRCWGRDTLYVTGSGAADHLQRLSGHRWAGIGSMANSWLFCARLHDLQSRDDLQREIVVPMQKLLAGVADSEAFAHCRSSLKPPAPSPNPDSAGMVEAATELV